MTTTILDTITINGAEVRLDRIGEIAKNYSGALPDLDLEIISDLNESCNANWGTDYDFGTIYRWTPAPGLYLYVNQQDGYGQIDAQYCNATLTEGDIEDYLSSWDLNCCDGTLEGLCVAYGVDPTLDVANEGDEGECKVWMERHYYQGTLGTGTQERYITEDDDREQQEGDTEPMVFANRAAAQAWIDSTYDETYQLAHGEYARPTYTITKA